MRLRNSVATVLAIGLALTACDESASNFSPPRSMPTTPEPQASTSPQPVASASAAPVAKSFAVAESDEADALFGRADTCTNPQIGYTVTFPDDWYTNTAIGHHAACVWFTPDFFEVDESGAMPEEIWINIRMVEGRFGYNELHPTVSSEEVEIAGLEGHRAEFRTLESVGDTESDDLTYHYVLPLDRDGPTLIAATDIHAADDYELAKAVLDRMMASMELGAPTFVAPTIPQEPTGPLVAGQPVMAQDADDTFRLTLRADQDRYRAGQEIDVDATLTYVGPRDGVEARGSGSGLIGFAIESDDPAIRITPSFTTDCRPHPMARGVAVAYPFGKSGSFSPDEPLAPFYEAYFASPELRLPAGTWTISAGGGWFIGDCGDGTFHELSASVTVVIEP